MTTKSPFFAMTPDFAPIMKMMAYQTEFAMQATQGMMKLAMMPWQGLQGMAPAYGSICTPFGVAAVKVAATSAETAEQVVEVAAQHLQDEIEAAPVVAKDITQDLTHTAEAAAAPVEEAVDVVAEPVEPTVDAVSEPVEEAAPDAAETGPVQPKALKAAKGNADDLTVLNGVGPKLAQTLNEFGIFHLDQIAKWTDQNVAWMDENLPGVKGRASKNGWVAQAAEIVK